MEENFCNNCISSYQPKNKAYTKLSGLHSYNYDPYSDLKIYNRENYYNSLGYAYKPGSDVSPDNSPITVGHYLNKIKHIEKENFCFDSYSKLNHTWSKQNSYTC